ncbi:MAG: BREX-2 system adenine-specific DNA-methyltransferase PglX, partial [Proteobacteria bacterium]|nr:BREX-2 system adenine-specific DNA-methyltransferase PglX [Pseudomonadota bacterium]
DAARAFIEFWRRTDSESGRPVHDFSDPDWNTRFLGDLYQDLSEDVRKRYALLQTPDFVESYILDRTLEPAIARFGLDDTTLIDPTCGSGHFLLGAFDRLFEHRLRAEPGIDPRTAAVKAMDCVYGADINPFAVAIARFRMTLAFLAKAGYARLAEAPALPLHLVVADSLRINPQHPQQDLWQAADAGTAGLWLGDVFAFDDERAAKDVLGRQYAAVVANPPYITVKDKALRDMYRVMYPRSASREYSLAAPFCERIFQLARPRGYTGQITANSFMKREFGRLLIESYLPTVNLTGIVNTSGAYIPGHGTPTVLLFGTQEPPQGADLPAVLAKRGEPSTPSDPSQGVVWRSIVDHSDTAGFENEFISSVRVARTSLAKHPWSLGGGGALELKELLEARAPKRLGDLVDLIGFGAVTREDDVFVIPVGAAKRLRLGSDVVQPYAFGETIRDWSLSHEADIVFPYSEDGTLRPDRLGAWYRLAWCYRTQLWARQGKGFKTKKEAGGEFYEYSMFYPDRHFAPLRIAFAFVATHNHFVLDRGGKVFNRSAPIIKLPEGATEDDPLWTIGRVTLWPNGFYL